MATQNKRMALVCAAMVVSSALVAAAAQAQGVSFIARRDFDTGRSPLSVAVGDFNGDGVQDLAVSQLHFQRRFGAGAGDTPSFVAVGDFNGDGAQDLAVANIYSDNVSVLINNTRLTLQPSR